MSKIKQATCKLFGHSWDVAPPWTGKEIRHRPYCTRCGHEPDEIVITGSAHTTENRYEVNA